VGYDRCNTTTEYTDAIIANLGRKPSQTFVREYRPIQLPQVTREPVMVRPQKRRVTGVDVFVEFDGTAEQLGNSMEQLTEGTALRLKAISSRGTLVYPAVGFMTDLVDHWTCRFVLRDDGGELGEAQVLDLLQRISSRYRWTHIEKLHEFDGQPGFTKAQGED
jgi:isocitrate dehydrogenase